MKAEFGRRKGEFGRWNGEGGRGKTEFGIEQIGARLSARGALQVKRSSSSAFLGQYALRGEGIAHRVSQVGNQNAEL